MLSQHPLPIQAYTTTTTTTPSEFYSIPEYVHKEKSNKMQNVSKFYYSIFIWNSTCFGRHTARHQGPKTALATSGFSYVKGRWTCRWWTFSGTLSLTTSTIYTQWILWRNALLIINSIFLIKMRVRENKGTLQQFNPLYPELNPICYLLALLGAYHFLHVSRIRVKSLTLRLLMSYIYIWH